MTEAELIKGCIRKNINCQRLLFDAYSGRLMTVCHRYCPAKHEAEDVLQETFIKIFQHIHQYKFHGSFEGWMKKIVVNCALKKLKKKKIKFEALSENVINIPYIQSSAQENLSEKELLQLIKSLPDGYRTVFNLFVMEEYSHDEIAPLLNIKPVTSRSQLLKAKKMLQQKIIVMKKLAL